MNRHVVFRVVSDIHLNSVSFSNIYSWPWKPSVYCDNRLGMTQPANIFHLNLEKIEKKNIKLV